MAFQFDGGSFARGQGGQTAHFPDPFCDMASLYLPETIREGLYWCEYIANCQGPYRAALERVVSYFLTDVQIVALRDKPLGREVKDKYLDFLNDTLGIRDILHLVAVDYLIYGNSMTSLLIPFRRSLRCRGAGCGHEAPLNRVASNPLYKFGWGDFKFHASCPQCGYHGEWDHLDRRSVDEERLIFKRWSPHEMELIHDPLTKENAYLWKILSTYREQVRSGRPLHVLERCPWEIVQAIKNNQNLQFDKDIIFHMRDLPMAGFDAGGWGLSRVLVNFRQAWYLQILQRFNEAIALDHIVPFRVITPATRPGSPDGMGDPLLQLNMGDFVSRVDGMLRAWRQDPARWNILPCGLEYQALGGDATQLAPKELIELGLDMLLTSIGVPVELYKGTLSLQAAPAALRLFEATWSHLVHNLNRFLDNLMQNIAQKLSWEPATAKLERVMHADDLNRQMAKLQLMMADRISRTTGMRSVGLDFGEETRQRLEEQRTESEATQEIQKEMEAAALMESMSTPGSGGGGGQGQAPAGPAPAGGAPAPAPATGGAPQQFAAQQPTQPNTPTSVEELQNRASWWAQTISTMPSTQRESTLIRLKQNDPTMHALVTSQLKDMDRQSQTALKSQMEQQKTGSEENALQQMLRDFGRPGRIIRY